MTVPPSGQGAIRPASRRELGFVSSRIREAVDASPHYGPLFKVHEKRRFSAAYLEALSAVDPWHVTIGLHSGQPAALVVTIPEYGTLWAAWVYTFPEAGSAAGLAAVRNSIRHWNGDRFHKACCFVQPGNRAARTIFKRVGFREQALLAAHVYGDDMLLCELPLTKGRPGYDDGVDTSRIGRWKRRIRAFARGG